MTSVEVKRNKNKTKKIIIRVSIRILVVLLLISALISIKDTYFGKKLSRPVSAANSIKKHTPKPKKNNPIVKNAVVMRNQKTDDGVKVEDAFVKDGKKTAYLTFDDGPSLTVTPKVLDTLKQNDVHATFFLVGRCIEENNKSINLVRRIYDEGNAIGNHSYSHDMKILFPNNAINVQTFMGEVDKTESILKGIFGQDFFARPLRVPGGYMSRQHYKDPNLGKFDQAIKDGNFASIDWTAYGFDAEGRPKSYLEIFNNIKKTVGNQQKVVILMHDTYGKEQTAKALPLVIQYLKSQGYEFKTLK